MKIDPNLFSMQVGVPHSKYGACDFFMPKEMDDWLKNISAMGRLVGKNSSGDGYTDGVTNVESVYMVNNIYREDALVFNLTFPGCRIHVSEQYVY